MITQKVYNIFLVVLSIGLIGDNLTTMLAINKYGIAAESNFIIIWLFNHIGYFGITIHAIMVFSLLLITTQYFNKVSLIFYSYSSLVIIGYVYIIPHNFNVWIYN